jgi:argininosuccinate lyase
MWGGRFQGALDDEFARFNASFRFDRRLIEADIESSIAYAEALAEAGVLSRQEADQIKSALERIRDRASSDPHYLEGDQIEDIHSFVEAQLVALIGDLGYKLHAGRSRNDQVATDLRLFLRWQIDSIQSLLADLQRAILELAEKHMDLYMPGYTHLQRAQPILFAHYMLAYFEMFKRDRARLYEVRSRVNILPLGSGAISGTGFPIDRERLARRLGFDGVSENSLDATSDRDFAIEFVGAAAITMMHLSRLAEDLVIYSSAEFGFVELLDAVSTGSSLMPQKRNPDPLELIRGKAGRVFGHLIALLAMMKGLPMAYNKDLQEDKEAVFDALDTLSGSLRVMATVLCNIRINGERMREAAASGYLNATDLADYLVRRGLEFRRAHELVGRIVSYAAACQKKLEELSLDEYRRFSPLFGEDLYGALTIEASLRSKSALGGTSPERVAAALARARAELNPS